MLVSQAQHLDKSREEIKRLKQVCLNQRGIKALNLDTEVTGDFQNDIESERQQDLTADLRDHCRQLKQKFTSAKKVRERHYEKEKRRVIQQEFCDKENLYGEEDSSMASYRNLPNAYKKAQDAGKSVERFKQKYQKLEENFRKFTSKLNENQKRPSSQCRATPNTSMIQKVNSSVLCPEISPIRASFHLNQHVPNISFQRASIKHQNMSQIQETFSGHNMLYPQTILGETAQIHLESEESLEQQQDNPFRNLDLHNVSFKRQPLQELSQDQNPQGRAQLLVQILCRFESNLKSYFDSLSALTVSKHQEQDISELYLVFHTQVQRLKRLNPMKVEQEQIMEVFNGIFIEIQKCFGVLLQNIYSVKSETFKSYKFKEVYKLFESLSSELFNFGQLDFYPTLLKMKVQTANTLMCTIIKRKDQMAIKRSVQVWKKETGFLYYQKRRTLQQVSARRAAQILISSEKLRVNKKFLLWTAKTQNQVVGLQVKENNIIEILLNTHLESSVISHQELYNSIKFALSPYAQEVHLLSKSKEDSSRFCDERLVQFKTDDILKSKSLLQFSFTQQEPVFISDIKGNKKFEQEFDLPNSDTVLKVFNSERGFISYFSAQFFDQQASRQFVIKAYSLNKIATEAQRREITIVLQQVKVFLKLVQNIRKERKQKEQEKNELDQEVSKLQDDLEVYSFVLQVDQNELVQSFQKEQISLVSYQTPQEEKKEENKFFEFNYKDYRFLFKEDPDTMIKRKTIATVDQVMLKIQEPIQELNKQINQIKEQQIQKQKIQDQAKEIQVLVKSMFMNQKEIQVDDLFRILQDKEQEITQHFLVNNKTKKVDTKWKEFLLSWAKEEAQVKEEYDHTFSLSSFFPKSKVQILKDTIVGQTILMDDLLVFSVKKPCQSYLIETFVQSVKQESDWAVRLQNSETHLSNLEQRLQQTITQAQEQNDEQREIITQLVQPLLKNLTKESLVNQVRKLFMRILGSEEVKVVFSTSDEEVEKENQLLSITSLSIRDRKKLRITAYGFGQIEQETLDCVSDVLKTSLTLLSMQDKMSVSVKHQVLPRCLLRIERATRHRNQTQFFLKLVQVQKFLVNNIQTKAVEDCNLEERININLKYEKVLKRLTFGFKQKLKVYFDRFTSESNNFLSYTQVVPDRKKASTSLDKCFKNQLTRQAFYKMAFRARKERKLAQTNQLWIFSFEKLQKVENRFVQRACLRQIDSKIKAQSSYQREKEDLQRKLEKENQMKQALKQLEQSQSSQKEMERDFQVSLDFQDICSSFNQELSLDHNLKVLANHLAHYLFLSGKPVTAELMVLTHRTQENKKLRQIAFAKEILQLAKQQELRLEERNGQKHQLIDSESTVKLIVNKQPNLELFAETWISEHRDIITSMLKRTQAVLTLSDIKQSLYELYCQHPQQKVQSRLNQIAQFRSATIFPILNHEGDVVASLELFSSVPQKESTEKGMRQIVKSFEQSVKFCFRQESQRKEIEKIVVETDRERGIRESQMLNAPQNLSQFLRTLYFQCPEQLQAQHVLPILLVPHAEQAYFYLFKDNHIYNFDSQETFVQEIVEKGCILELEATYEGSPTRSSQRSLHSYKTNQSVKRLLESVKTVTNEEFEHVIYYPIFDRRNSVRAILEVAYSKKEFVPENLLTQKVSQVLSRLQIQLETFHQQLNCFAKSTNSIFREKERQSRTKAFQRWKLRTTIQREKEIQKQKEIQTLSETEEQYQKYMKSIDHYDEELKQAVSEKETLNKHIKLLRVEKKAKLKFLATALLYASVQEKAQSHLKVKNLFSQWKSKVTSLKIAETAFNQILEHNHKHSDARFDTACFLIERMFFSQAQSQIKSSFQEIQLYVEGNRIVYNQPLRNESFMDQSQFESQLLREANGYQSRDNNFFASRTKNTPKLRSNSKTPVKTPQKQLKINQSKHSQILTTYGSNYSVIHQS